MKYTKYNKSLDYSYTLGITLTIELIKKHKEDLLDIYYSTSFNGESKTLIDSYCKDLNITPIVSDKIFNILSNKENIFVIGVFKKFYNKINNNTNHICLVNPSNAGNLGTILRTASGFGIENIAIITPSVDLFDPKTIRASMGAIFNLNVTLYENFQDYLNSFKNYNIYTFMLQAKTKLHETKFLKPFTLVFGNEATGLDKSYLDYNSVIIKHNNSIDSLNLPIATSIAIYEATKSNF